MSNAGPNPDHGYTTFDNIGWSLVMALQILTMDFWENLYDKVLSQVEYGCTQGENSARISYSFLC